MAGSNGNLMFNFLRNHNKVSKTLVFERLRLDFLKSFDAFPLHLVSSLNRSDLPGLPPFHSAPFSPVPASWVFFPSFKNTELFPISLPLHSLSLCLEFPSPLVLPSRSQFKYHVLRKVFPSQS